MTRVQSVPALVAGLLLIVIGVVLWVLLSGASVTKNLFTKLPEDSRVAGVARLDAFDYDTLQQTADSAKVYPAETKALVAAIRQVAPPELIGKALGSEVGFARVPGDRMLAVVTIRDETAYLELARAASSTLEGAKQIQIDTPERGRLTFFTAHLPKTKVQLFAYRDGKYVYFATDKNPILGAVGRTKGFDRREGFAAVSSDLPGSQDAYVFLDDSLVSRYPRLSYSLVGLAIKNEKTRLHINVANANPPRVRTKLGRMSGELLPPVSDAPLSVSGTDVVTFFRMLEEQRSEQDLPGVLRFQNGVASLNRQLGVDIERDYLAAATGRFVYARYRNGDARPWMGLLEFANAQTARQKVDELQGLLKAKVTVPVRREVVRVLPDGTESREIESERNEPLSIKHVIVEGQSAGSMRLPSMGRTVWQVRDRYLLVGSSEEAVGRLVRMLAFPSPVDAKGQAVLRIEPGKVASVTGKEDGLFTWILFARPERGTFDFDKRSGELTGGVTFAER
jgi:hypothetical protein